MPTLTLTFERFAFIVTYTAVICVVLADLFLFRAN
jgi:hypothetical protein